VDIGRVLGYDNQHDHHHRHFMGQAGPFEYAGYDVLLDRFLAEVEVLRTALKGTRNALGRVPQN
jgi:hypothetical protein